LPVAGFFAGTITAEEEADGKATDIVPCEIAVSDFDAAIFSGVEALLSGKSAEAQACVDAAEHSRTLSDDQALYRLLFLRYKTLRETGNIEDASRVAKRLSVSGVAPFQRQAESFLAEH
jgi:hypothetical protein